MSKIENNFAWGKASGGGGGTVDPALKRQVQQNTSDISDIKREQQSITNDIGAIKTKNTQQDAKIQTNDLAIRDLKPKVQTLETNYTALNNAAVKTTGNQNIAGNKTFTAENGTIMIDAGNGKAGFIGFAKGGSRKAFIGLAASSENFLTIKSEGGDLKLTSNSNINVDNKRIINLSAPVSNNDAATKKYVDDKVAGAGGGGSAVLPSNILYTDTAQNISGIKTFTTKSKINIDPTEPEGIANKRYVDNQVNTTVKTSGDQIINGNKEFRGTPTFGQVIQGGYGGGFLHIVPEDNSSKTLKFGNSTSSNNKRFTRIDLESRTYIKNVPEPQEGSDAASKWYVDTEIAKHGGGQPSPQPQHQMTFKTWHGTIQGNGSTRIPAGTNQTQKVAGITVFRNFNNKTWDGAEFQLGPDGNFIATTKDGRSEEVIVNWIINI